MSAKRPMSPIGLGFKARKGGAVIVGVARVNTDPRIVLSAFLDTAVPGDRLTLEPYHVAAGMARSPDGGASREAIAAVAEGRNRQAALAVKGLEAIIRELRSEGYAPAVGALLVNRAGWVGDLLAYSLAFPDHPPVAEGLAVRDALRFACRHHRLKLAEMDETSLSELGSETLGLSPGVLEARLKTLGAAVGPPWRKEQKHACLAAWLAQTRR